MTEFIECGLQYEDWQDWADDLSLDAYMSEGEARGYCRISSNLWWWLCPVVHIGLQFEVKLRPVVAILTEAGMPWTLKEATKVLKMKKNAFEKRLEIVWNNVKTI